MGIKQFDIVDQEILETLGFELVKLPFQSDTEAVYIYNLPEEMDDIDLSLEIRLDVVPKLDIKKGAQMVKINTTYVDFEKNYYGKPRYFTLRELYEIFSICEIPVLNEAITEICEDFII